MPAPYARCEAAPVTSSAAARGRPAPSRISAPRVIERGWRLAEDGANRPSGQYGDASRDHCSHAGEVHKQVLERRVALRFPAQSCGVRAAWNETSRVNEAFRLAPRLRGCRQQHASQHRPPTGDERGRLRSRRAPASFQGTLRARNLTACRLDGGPGAQEPPLRTDRAGHGLWHAMRRRHGLAKQDKTRRYPEGAGMRSAFLRAMTTGAALQARGSLVGAEVLFDSRKLGATPTRNGARFALFATTTRSAAVRLFEPGTLAVRTTIPLRASAGHLFEADVEGIGPGTLYKFVLDGREFPDPYARFLPHGVHGPARVEDRGSRPPDPFVARPMHQWVIYEIHVGASTPEGTYRAAMGKLEHLAGLGVNVIELMPVASFAGSRGWGYDGVALYAPFSGYGEPQDLRELVRQAHARGIAVMLDVVYNHLGPAGNYLPAYSPDYFTSDHKTAWGDAPNFAEPHMRGLVLDNVRYWLEEFDFDGLRLDATHGIVDPSASHILSEIARVAHSFDRPRVLLAEDERNDPALVEKYGLDGVWADDFHHSVRVTLTGERDGYYSAYHGGAEELARTIDKGWLYEGQPYPPTQQPRGRPATLRKQNLVYCIQNHDQVGNRALGDRLTDHVSAEAFAGVSMLLLFLPAVPLIFMGQEWASSTSFLFFTDHEEELGAAITRGRRAEFKDFRGFEDPVLREQIPDPQAASTFERSKLDWGEPARGHHAAMVELYRQMLHLRATDPVLSAEGTVSAIAEAGLVVVTRESAGGRRVLLFNPTDTAIANAQLGYGATPLLASASPDGGRLPPRSATVLGVR